MDMTADEVQLFYEQKIREERRKAMKTYSVRSLVMSVIIFLVSLTVLVMAGSEPPPTSYIPSAIRGTESLKYEYRVASRMEPMLIPIEGRK
jgi:hypothetical protein